MLAIKAYVKKSKNKLNQKVTSSGLFPLADSDSDSDTDSCTMQIFPLAHIWTPLIEMYVIGTETCP